MDKQVKEEKKMKKRKSLWTEEDLENAIHELLSVPGSTKRGVGKKYGIDESTIRFRLKKLANNEDIKRPGRNAVLTKEMEKNLARYFSILFNSCFNPYLNDLLRIAHEYLNENECPTSNGANKKNNRPGQTWLRNLLKKYRLSHKKAELITYAIKSNITNPFITYNFFDELKKILESNTEITASRIWSCKEMGFPVDISKFVESEQEQEIIDLCYNANKENITVLGTCNAEGALLNPAIIFKRQVGLSQWQSDNLLKGTWLAESETGMADKTAFEQWFFMFSKLVEDRPLLLLVDCQLSYLSIPTINKALQENIIILKYPPHSDHIIEPFHMSIGKLKHDWERFLHKRFFEHGTKESLSKPEFVDKLCCMWHDSMDEEKIVSSFSMLGIFPVDCKKYPVCSFDDKLLKMYDAWRESGEIMDWDRLCNRFKDESSHHDRMNIMKGFETIHLKTSRHFNETTQIISVSENNFSRQHPCENFSRDSIVIEHASEHGRECSDEMASRDNFTQDHPTEHIVLKYTFIPDVSSEQTSRNNFVGQHSIENVSKENTSSERPTEDISKDNCTSDISTERTSINVLAPQLSRENISSENPSSGLSNNSVLKDSESILRTLVGPYPFDPPPGFKWIPKWELAPTSYSKPGSSFNMNSGPKISAGRQSKNDAL